ncbi:MAG: molybdopterin biosynthesis protein [Firmicutes bacterium]|nr:molybdopterin biosynthesis protein [Bacillota bacterium]
MAKRNLYLNNTPMEEAKAQYLAALRPLIKPRTETIDTAGALGRVTAAAVYARCCSPLFNAAAMDGIAVTAGQTASARETAPLTLVRDQDFRVVDTGDPIHPPYDAVIMAEDVIVQDDDHVQIIASANPWQHVRPIGEDIVAGEMLLPGRHRIRPIDVGVLLSGGITKVEVLTKPSVAIIPTGTEIIEPDQEPQEGDIIESNSRMFAALVEEAGGAPLRFDILPDDYELLRNTVAKAVDENDMVIVNAGSSAGTEDFTVHVLRELGEVLIHGVAVKPGKPVILAIVKGKPVIGLPGYPVSAYIDFTEFAAPVLQLFTGVNGAQEGERVKAVISKRLVSSLKHLEYVRVKAGRVGDKLVASPLARGAGAAMSLVRADGFCLIPQNSEGVEAGDEVELSLYRPLKEIENTLVAVGSHDLILDVLADIMPNRFPGCYLSSTHVGSMGGLMALGRGEAHLAPTHLLDEDSGVYNVSYLHQLFPNEKMALIKGVNRIQGFIVKPGNPLDIHSVADLTRCRYVNRQRGAGTRVLLDYLLKKQGVDKADINGYEREAATHMAVAAAVNSDSADCGMGIMSAARALGLDFVEVGPEEYDFAIPVRFLELPLAQHFLELLRSEEFHQRLAELGGYGWGRCGEIVYI